MNLTDYLVEKVIQRRENRGRRTRRVLVWLTHSWARLGLTVAAVAVVVTVAVVASVGHSVWGSYRHVEALRATSAARAAASTPTPAVTVDPSAPSSDTADQSGQTATADQRTAAVTVARGFATGLLDARAQTPEARVAAVAAYAGQDEQQVVAATDPATLPTGQVASAFADPAFATANAVPVTVSTTDGGTLTVSVFSDGQAWTVVDFQAGT